MKRKKTAQKKSARKMTGGVRADAIALLEKDHKEVQAIFRKYRALTRNGNDSNQKLVLVKKACEALSIHARIEEEIFYPAISEVVDKELLAEAFVEHDGAKDLIDQLQDMEPDDPLFDARFIVLGEQVKHHIEEEETKIFPKLRRARIDLEALGRDMKTMKEEMEDEVSFPQIAIPREESPSYVT